MLCSEDLAEYLLTPAPHDLRAVGQETRVVKLALWFNRHAGYCYEDDDDVHEPKPRPGVPGAAAQSISHKPTGDARIVAGQARRGSDSLFLGRLREALDLPAGPDLAWPAVNLDRPPRWHGGAGAKGVGVDSAVGVAVEPPTAGRMRPTLPRRASTPAPAGERTPPPLAAGAEDVEFDRLGSVEAVSSAPLWGSAANPAAASLDARPVATYAPVRG